MNRETLLLLTAMLPLGCGDDGGDDVVGGSTGTEASDGTTGGSATLTPDTDAPGDESTTSGVPAAGTSSTSGPSGATEGTGTEGSTGSTGGEGTIPLLEKELLRDLLPDLQARGGLVPEKIEGAAVLANGDVLIVNDNDGIDGSSGETLLVNLGDVLGEGDPPAPPTSVESYFDRVATFPVCLQDHASCDSDTSTVAEISAASEDGNTLIYTDSPGSRLGFVDIGDVSAPVGLGTLSLPGEPTSVAVRGGYALAAVNTSADFVTVSGELVVVDIETRAEVHAIALPGQPDAVAVSPDGNYAAIVIENERDEDLEVGGVEGGLPQLPAGSLVVLDTSDADPTSWTIAHTVDLTGLEGLYEPTDPEPEYVDINATNTAVVTLQENNGLALVDLATGDVTSSFSAGAVDLTAIDVVEEDPASISLTGMLTGVVREPDAVAWISADRFATANEGDLRGGSRSFTVFGADGSVDFEAGNALEHAAVRVGHYPDARSENRGVEPEGIEFGQYGDTGYLFVASERASLIYVYDVSGESPSLVQILPSAAGPEGLLAIPQRNLFISSSEEDAREDGLRAGISIYAYGPFGVRYPTLQSADRADDTPIPWGALSGLAAGEGATAYAVLDSYYQRTRILEIDTSAAPATIVGEIALTDPNGVFEELDVAALEDATVDPDHPSRAAVFDEADLDALVNDDGTVNLDGEGIAVASDGGFWVASEGAGTVGDADRPIESLNFLVKTDPEGVIERVVTLPEAVDAMQVRFGYEGVAEWEGRVYVAFQRAWGDEAEPRVGVFDPEDDTWRFFFYPLDEVASQNGGWVGLSDLTSLGDGLFMVVERDDQPGPDAAIKRLYTFSVEELAPAAE